MLNKLSLPKIVNASLWFVWRLVLLNAFILILFYLVSAGRFFFEPMLPIFILPFELYMVALFLTNLVYIIGNVYEIVYLLMWNKVIEVRTFERKFFKAAILMTLIIQTAGVILYFVELNASR